MNIETVRKRLLTHKVEFEEQRHTYTLDGKLLRSVGSVCKQFKVPFDSDYWSKVKARQRGVTQQAILDEWAAKGKKATDDGSAFHKYAQKRLEGKFDVATTAKMKAFDRWWKVAGESLEIVACEVVLWDAKDGIAGTTDFVAYSRKSKKYHVFDWKTNKSFDTISNYGKFLLPPFDRFEECHLSDYSLQTGLYRLMATRISKAEFGDSYILHVGDEITPHQALPTANLWITAIKQLKEKKWL